MGRGPHLAQPLVHPPLPRGQEQAPGTETTDARTELLTSFRVHGFLPSGSWKMVVAYGGAGKFLLKIHLRICHNFVNVRVKVIFVNLRI